MQSRVGTIAAIAAAASNSALSARAAVAQRARHPSLVVVQDHRAAADVTACSNHPMLVGVGGIDDADEVDDAKIT